MLTADHARVRTLHTLGPSGTNLELAAHEWLSRRGNRAVVELHETLESALPGLPLDGTHVVLACAAYPRLHDLIFDNLDRLAMVDSFLMPTHNMVLASTGTRTPGLVATHPAPRSLVPPGARVRLATSNAQAAVDCRDGFAEGCITTLVAARTRGLRVLRDFGPVPMVYTLHLVAARAVAEVA